MGRSRNIVLGAFATALITVGVAAQTGTVKWPGLGEAPAAGGAVQAQEATASPAMSSEPSTPPSR